MDPLTHGFVLIVKIISIIFIADFTVGFFHWLEDNYGQEDWPIVGEAIIKPNLLHHSKPKDFLHKSWWQSARYQVFAGLILFAMAYAYGLLTWELILFAFLAINGNEVHKWTHRSKKENGKIITWLQTYKFLQGRRHHGRHHGGNKNTHYCTLTEWVNPILESIHIWRLFEWIIKKVSGVSPRIDPSVLQRQQSTLPTADAHGAA